MRETNPQTVHLLKNLVIPLLNLVLKKPQQSSPTTSPITSLQYKTGITVITSPFTYTLGKDSSVEKEIKIMPNSPQENKSQTSTDQSVITNEDPKALIEQISQSSLSIIMKKVGTDPETLKAFETSMKNFSKDFEEELKEDIIEPQIYTLCDDNDSVNDDVDAKNDEEESKHDTNVDSNTNDESDDDNDSETSKKLLNNQLLETLNPMCHPLIFLDVQRKIFRNFYRS